MSIESNLELRRCWSILLVNQSLALLISAAMLDSGRTMQRMAIALLVINGLLWMATIKVVTIESRKAVARLGIVITWITFLVLCIRLGT